jgi:hypothetical protein
MTITAKDLLALLMPLLAPLSLPQILIDKVRVTFENAEVRSILINETPHYNVYDFLRNIESSSENSRKIWSRLKEKQELIANAAQSHAFVSGRPSPIVPLKTLVEIMWAIGFLTTKRKPKTKKHVKKSHEARRDMREEVTKVKHRESYDQTTGYIRIRMPEECVSGDPVEKEISRGVIKFGIAYSIRERDVSYQNDNGFMAFSYNFNERWEAATTERIMRREFDDITCYNSKEYLDTTALAKRFGFDEYNADSYASYTELACRLFARMVSIAKVIWPHNYRENHGFVHKVKTRVTEIDDIITKTEVSFSREPITNDRANALGLVDPITKLTHEVADLKAKELQLHKGDMTHEISKMQLANTTISPDDMMDMIKKIQEELADVKAHEMGLEDSITKLTNDLADVKAELERVKNNNVTATGPVPIVPPQSEEMPPQQPGKPRSHGVVIGRDLRTGEDLRYASAERAANACGMTAASFRRSVMNRRRQLNGCHWRSEGLAIWVPPTGFCYDGQFDSQSTNLMFVVADKAQGSSGDTENQRKIFESITAAARIMNLDRRKLSDIVAHQREYGGYVWSTLDMEKCGTMIEDADAPVPVPNAALDAGISLRCAGRVIARDLATGAEKVYDSVTRAAAMSGMSALTMREQLLDKPRQGFGRIFRSFVSTTRWEPPENLVFDPKKYVKTSGYVKSVDKDGNVKLYESIWEATSILGLHKSAVQQCIDTGKVSSKLGLLWYRAEEKDFMNMVPCEPPSASKS